MCCVFFFTYQGFEGLKEDFHLHLWWSDGVTHTLNFHYYEAWNDVTFQRTAHVGPDDAVMWSEVDSVIKLIGGTEMQVALPLAPAHSALLWLQNPAKCHGKPGILMLFAYCRSRTWPKTRRVRKFKFNAACKHEALWSSMCGKNLSHKK